MTQIDDISAAIGEIRAYIHEHRHSSANLSAKFDALPILIRKGVAELELKLTQQIKELDANHAARLETETRVIKADVKAFETRVNALEAVNDRRNGAMGLADWTIKSPVFAWISAILAVLGAFFFGKEG